MNVEAELLKEHSKEQCHKIVEWIGKDAKKFKQLFNLFINGEYRITQRAAWPLSISVIAHPELMKGNYTKLISNLKNPHLHDAIKRNTIRLLQHVPIPEEQEGSIMEVCFQYLESPDEAVAVKAFSLTVLGRLAKKYPEIVPEIKLLIEEQLPHQTAAFKSRAKLFLKMAKS